MKCICGYSFAHASLESPRPFENFALIDDKQYKKFLRAELKAVASKQLSDISKASRFVGNLCICPDCGVVCVAWSDTEKPCTYLAPVTTVADPQSVDK